MTIFGIEGGSLLGQLATAAARATVLAAIAGLLLTAFRVKATRIRLFAWTMVLYAAVTMPLLGTLLPSVGIPVPFGRAPELSNIAREVHTGTEAPPRQFTLQEAGTTRARSASLASTPQTLKGNTSRNATIVFSWVTAALAGYLVIGALLLARFIVGVMFARRLGQNAIAIEDPRLRRQVHSPNLGRVPEVRETQSVSVPLTIGVLKPTILLPTTWREWDEAKLLSVLTHEMSHIARQDCLSQHVSLVHRAIFWFSPFSWWLNRQIIQLAEQASDEEVLSRGTDQTQYARTLLGFFETAQAASGRIRWQGVSMASSGQAEQRVEKVLEWRGDKGMATRKFALMAVIVLAIPVSYLVAAGRPVTPSPAAPAQDTVPAAPSTQPVPPPASDTAPAHAIPPQAPDPVSDDVVPRPPSGSPAAPPSPDLLAANAAQDKVNKERHEHGFSYRHGDDDEQRFVIVSGKSKGLTMSGSGEDARHAEKLKQRIPGDFIWFQRDEKSYIIRDQATVDRARQLWAPQEELGKKQETLGKQQEALGRQQEELGKQMQAVRVKVPDLTAKLDKLKAELQQLGPEASVQQLGNIQGEMGRLQAELGRVQSGAGDEQGRLGEQMGALGEKQGELGRQQGELGRQQGELAEKASKEMKELLDDAIKKGIAQPENMDAGGASF